MGVVTEVTIRLTPLPQSVRTLLAVFETVDQAIATVSDIIAAGVLPAALEMIDTFIIKACEEAFHLGFPLDAEAVLIIELDGLEVGLDDETQRAKEIAMRNGAREVREARTDLERALFWKARKQAFGALGRLGQAMVTHDGVIPRTRLPEVLREVRAIAETARSGGRQRLPRGRRQPSSEPDVRRARPGAGENVMHAGEEILQLCVDVGGSVTGEHGIGMEKAEALGWMFSEADLALMERSRKCSTERTLQSRQDLSVRPSGAGRPTTAQSSPSTPAATAAPPSNWPPIRPRQRNIAGSAANRWRAATSPSPLVHSVPESHPVHCQTASP